MEPTECSETSAFNTQTPGKYPEDNVPLLQHGESLKTVNLPVVLYGCETWSLTLRVECRLRVFENGVLRRKFEPTKEEVTREWRKLHNEEHDDLSCSPNIVRVVKSRRLMWVGHVARMGEKKGVCRVLVRKPKGK